MDSLNDIIEERKKSRMNKYITYFDQYILGISIT